MDFFLGKDGKSFAASIIKTKKQKQVATHSFSKTRPKYHWGCTTFPNNFGTMTEPTS